MELLFMKKMSQSSGCVFCDIKSPRKQEPNGKFYHYIQSGKVLCTKKGPPR